MEVSGQLHAPAALLPGIWFKSVVGIQVVLHVENSTNFNSFFFFLYGAAAHIGLWPPLYEVP
jgi:hypothetical protein